MAVDIRELIMSLDLREVNLLGHSGGVKYIWAYTEIFGDDRLNKLVIVDDSPRLIDNPAWSDASRAEVGPMYFTGDLDRFAVQLLDKDGEAFTAVAMRSMFSSGFVERKPELMDWIIAENLKMPRELAVELLYATSGIDWRGTIKRIRRPSLVVGAEGSTHKASVLRWIAGQIPGSELRIWSRAEGGSHFMFIENPDKFNHELARFLA
jgi:pimeloyl-ACP methyl ester carboxylesterase